MNFHIAIYNENDILWTTGAPAAVWSPAADVKRAEGGWRMTAALVEEGSRSIFLGCVHSGRRSKEPGEVSGPVRHPSWVKITSRWRKENIGVRGWVGRGASLTHWLLFILTIVSRWFSGQHTPGHINIPTAKSVKTHLYRRLDTSELGVRLISACCVIESVSAEREFWSFGKRVYVEKEIKLVGLPTDALVACWRAAWLGQHLMFFKCFNWCLI